YISYTSIWMAKIALAISFYLWINDGTWFAVQNRSRFLAVLSQSNITRYLSFIESSLSFASKNL
ncbi:hypothetical protein, partial [Edwardsiella tarda]|uniref:hypothetical protein n=1 Tax=Edwardsiella tarda TaxID=636 RepID=UPI0019681CC1